MAAWLRSRLATIRVGGAWKSVCVRDPLPGARVEGLEEEPGACSRWRHQHATMQPLVRVRVRVRVRNRRYLGRLVGEGPQCGILHVNGEHYNQEWCISASFTPPGHLRVPSARMAVHRTCR